MRTRVIFGGCTFGLTRGTPAWGGSSQQAVIDYARGHVEILQLDVVSENEAARRLYASLGFVEYGIERNALKQHGRYYDEVLMAKDLSR